VFGLLLVVVGFCCKEAVMGSALAVAKYGQPGLSGREWEKSAERIVEICWDWNQSV